MRTLKLASLVLVAAGCTQSTTNDTAEELSAQDRTLEPHSQLWSRYHHHGDAGVATDSGTTQNDAGTTTVDSGTTTVDSGTTTVDSGTSMIPAGWLYTQGAKIYASNGTSGTQWMGRGVNVDDLYFCGYNGSLWMSNAESTLTSLTSKLVSTWNPTFVRLSLSMNSYTQSSWSGSYKTAMTNVINAIGANPGVYVMVTLRSDASMQNYGTDDATYLPTSSTDSVYQALVDTFANSKFVMFGVANEPGGNALSNATIRSAMDHAVTVIRAEEDKLGTPHHIVSVQGNNWTSDISFYSTSPLTEDNVVYEVHGYPPSAASYTYSNIPVVIGEYGTLTNSSTFFADLESKQIPSLAWDFDSFSNCAPDLLSINQSATNLVPTTWGSSVQTYLLAH